MGRIMAFDVGRVRIGVAVTDMLQMIANGIATVEAEKIHSFVKMYLEKETVEKFVVGLPKQMNATDSESMPYIKAFVEELQKSYPEKPIEMVDERFTSKIAQRTMIESGLHKKGRQNKALVDQISATIILQTYLELNRI